MGTCGVGFCFYLKCWHFVRRGFFFSALILIQPHYVKIISFIIITEFWGTPLAMHLREGPSRLTPWEPAFNQPLAATVSVCPQPVLQGGYYWPHFRDEEIKIREVKRLA